MEATILGDGRTDRPGTISVVGYVGAVAFAVASVWYALAVGGITVTRTPVFVHEALAERFRIYYAWVVETLPQERLYVSLAIVGFVCLASLAVLMARSFGTALARTGAFLLGLGSTLWIVGNILQLGGHRAVGSMAVSGGHGGNALPTVSAIFFTIDRIDDAFETAAFAVLGVAMLALASVAIRNGGRGWGRYTGAIGALSLILSVAYIADKGDAVNVLLLVLGVVILPVWLVWTGTRFANAKIAGQEAPCSGAARRKRGGSP